MKPSNYIMNLYTKYMLVIGVVGNLAFYLQAYVIFSNKSAFNISVYGFIISLISVTSWFVYGLLKRDRVLIFSNIIAIVGALSVLLGVWIYR